MTAEQIVSLMGHPEPVYAVLVILLFLIITALLGVLMWALMR